MAKGVKYVVCLASSLTLNLFLLWSLYDRRVFESERGVVLSWSQEAAAEAEAVAALTCSGHGRAYVDGIPSDGGEKLAKCECHTCYGGAHCEHFFPHCPADADSGDPLFLEPFWLQHAKNSAILVAGWHRMSYHFDDGSMISNELERHIRELHKVIGNAVTNGRYILFGAGSTQLLNAAVLSLSLSLSTENSTSLVGVVASVPFYPLYQRQTEFFKSVEFKWEGDTSLWKNKSYANGPLIEFVTSPNNPDGKLKKQVLGGPNVKQIFDRAYYWPYFTAIPNAADEDLMIFTLSKLTGHAGSRFGWAIIKDDIVYQRMSMFIGLNSMGVSRDTQVRALKLVKVILKSGGREIFEFGYNSTKTRWENLSKTLLKSKQFSLQKMEPQYCTYFQDTVGPSPAYAWIKCERKEDKDCNEVLKSANIIGREGTVFGAERRFVRLSMIKSDDDFNLLLQKLDALVSSEVGATYI